MVRYKPARPALATAICFYEIVVVLLALLGIVLSPVRA
jgi:hypothetical protein